MIICCSRFCYWSAHSYEMILLLLVLLLLLKLTTCTHGNAERLKQIDVNTRYNYNIPIYYIFYIFTVCTTIRINASYGIKLGTVIILTIFFITKKILSCSCVTSLLCCFPFFTVLYWDIFIKSTWNLCYYLLCCCWCCCSYMIMFYCCTFSSYISTTVALSNGKKKNIIKSRLLVFKIDTK